MQMKLQSSTKGFLIGLALAIGGALIIANVPPTDPEKAYTEYINVLQNPGFELGRYDYTASGGTFALTSSAELRGQVSATWDASGVGQTLSSGLYAVPEELQEKPNCLAVFKYQWPSGVAGDILLRVVDGSSQVLASTSIAGVPDTIPPSTVTNYYELQFQCPSSGSFRWQLYSAVANPAIITIDSLHLGSDIKEVQVQEPQIVAQIAYGPTASCVWTNTGTTLDAFATTAACASPVAEFLANGVLFSTADNNLPVFNFTGLPEGRYVATVTGTMQVSGSANAEGTIAIRDVTGATTLDMAAMVNSNDDGDPFALRGAFAQTSFGARSLEMYSQVNAGTMSLYAATNTGWDTTIRLTLTRYPLNPVSARSYDTMGWFVDVNISGANVSMGTADITTYDEITDTGLTLTTRPGSAPAEIPCLSGTASTGSTCVAVAESIGVVFTPPEAGYFKVCSEFGHYTQVGSPGQANVTFQIIETPNATDAVTQEGGSRIASYSPLSATASIAAGHPLHVCGIFNFTTPSERTVRLMREQDTTATVTDNYIRANGDTNVGQPDIHITVERWTGVKPAPVVNNIWTAPFLGAIGRQFIARLNCDAGSSEISDPQDFVSAIGNITAGACAVTFSANRFPTAVFCPGYTIIATGGTPFIPSFSVAPTTAGVTIDCDQNDGTDCTSFDAELFCIGY